jgi:MscS family membrane protein
MNWDKILEQKYFEVVATLLLFVALMVVRTVFRKIIKRHAKIHELEYAQRKYANKFLNFILSMVFILILGFIWDVSVHGLTIYFASFFTVVGVALFANWSILSNITASLILFFNYPFKIGSKITIMDKEDSITGVVLDITFFSIQIKTKEGHVVSYPNNIAIQKAIIKEK